MNEDIKMNSYVRIYSNITQKSPLIIIFFKTTGKKQAMFGSRFVNVKKWDPDSQPWFTLLQGPG